MTRPHPIDADPIDADPRRAADPGFPPVPPGADPWPYAGLRDYFAGAWSLDRAIRDRSRAAPGRFEGTAVFEPAAGGGLDYEESGVLRIDGAEVEARQSYLYRFEPDGCTAQVLFPDGRLFHPLRLKRGLCRPVHPCGKDLYRGLIAVWSPDAWCAVWWVTGPHKALRLATAYRRLSADMAELERW